MELSIKYAKQQYNEIAYCDGYFIGPMTIYPFSQKPFEYYCEKYNIEFIEPNL